MHSIQHKFHEIRYKVDYMKTRYRQRYYSNERNPRVIQTKLLNQRLLSLRTHPHDKYFIKPGEFLALVPKKLDKQVNEIIEINTEKYLKARFLHQKDLFKGFDDSAIVDKTSSISDSNETKIRRFRSLSDSALYGSSITEKPIKFNYPLQETNNTISKYRVMNSSNHEKLESYFSDIPISGTGRFADVSMDSSPLIDLSTTTTNVYERETEAFASSNSSGRTTLQQSKKLKKSKKPSSRFFFNFSGKQSAYTKNNPQLNIDTDLEYNNSTTGTLRSPKIWETVLNAVSLSAAKVSVGYPPKKISEFTNLKSDFIDAKNLENQIPQNFTNLTLDEYAYSQDYYQKDNLKIYTGRTEKLKFVDGNILRYPTINTAISHYYSEGGVVSLYNYNSDDDSQI